MCQVEGPDPLSVACLIVFAIGIAVLKLFGLIE
jgi:hypothetical protein